MISEVAGFADDNASTTETDENKTHEDIEEIDDEEGIDGVSSEGEKTSGGTETAEVMRKKNFLQHLQNGIVVQMIEFPFYFHF